MVITGGCDTLNDILMHMCFSKTPALSHTGDCRPFSDKADGTLLGEGLGMVALKRLENAERDGDHIYAVIRGVGSSSDGRARASTRAARRSGQGLAACLRAGWLRARHGGARRSSRHRDQGRRRSRVPRSQTRFGGASVKKQWCALGSVKSQIGHTKAAAGAGGLFKAVMALNHGVLPPTIKVDQPNPGLEIEESPFYINTEARPWVRNSDHPRRAGVSSFGFGGSNFHIAVEEYRGPAPRATRLRTMPDELVVFEADDAATLVATMRAVEIPEKLSRTDAPELLAFLARSTQEAYTGQKTARLAVIAKSCDDLKKKLVDAALRIEKAPGKPFAGPKGMHFGLDQAGDVAFVFPGQGSQYLGMGGQLASSYDAALGAWDVAADLSLDERLHEVVFPRPAFDDETKAAQAAKLVRTEWAQPAIGAVSLSQLRLLRAMHVKPACVGGHSYGEVTALGAAACSARPTCSR